MARNKCAKNGRRLSGAVLIMVVAVMFVLIVLLLATLTVVSTAQNRYYTKYEENQAYYTARSALDLFTNNLLKDKEYYAYDGTNVRTYAYGDSSNPANTANMKQGLALQLDLYKIKAQSGNNVDQSDLLAYVNGITDASLKKDEYKTYYGTDSTAVQTASGKEYIEYQTTVFPATSSQTDDFGKMVDTNSGTIQATIRVEVLDRTYNLGTYTVGGVPQTVPETDTADFFAKTGAYTGVTDNMIAEAVVNGERSKDTMRLKVTATVSFMGVEGTAVLVYDTNEVKLPSADQALTTTGNLSGASGAAVRTAGGAATMDIGTTNVGDGNNMSGSIFSLGSLMWTSSASTTMNSGDSIVAMDGIISSSNPTNITASGNDTYVFLGGTSTLNNGGQFGNAANPIPVIAEKIIKTSDTDLYFCGDVYVTTFESQASNPGKIHTDAGKTMYVQNLIIPDYCFSEPVPGTIEVNLDHFLNANIQLCSGYTISSAGGLYTINSINLSSYTLKNAVNISFSATYAAFDKYAYTAVKDSDGKIHKQYTLPFTVSGKNTIDVPTAHSEFSDYFKSGAFHDNSGELKNFVQQSKTDPKDPVNEYTTIYSASNKSSWLLTGADMLADYLKLPDLNPGDPARTITSMISGGTIKNGAGTSFTVNSMPTGSYTFDLSSGDQYYVLDSTYYNNCKWTVTGSNGRLILLMRENFGNVDPGTGGKAASAMSIKFENCELVTNVIDTTTTSIKNGTTKAPPVDIYGGTGSYLSTVNNNLICGYIMMPTGFVYMQNGKINVAYDNGNGDITNIANTEIVGSLLCQEFEEMNQVGIVFLDKQSGKNALPGEPVHDFKSYQYTRY